MALAKTIKDAISKVLFRGVFPREYRRAAKAPIQDNKVLLVEARAMGVSDDLKLIYQRLMDDGSYDVHVHFLGESRVGRGQYFRNCLALVRDVATARYVFLTDACNVIGSLPMRPGTYVTQVWHACGAFKKWGMSTADKLFGGTREQKLAYPHYGNLSLVSISSPLVAWAYIEAMHLEDRPQIVKALGTSRTDVFFDEAWLAKARQQVEAAVPQVRGRKIVLYAPTFRGRVAHAQAPDQLDMKQFCKQLGKTHVLLVKQHPFVKEPTPIPEECANAVFDVSGSLPIDALLATADICITDYSSVVFEYSLMRRPIAFFAYDKEDYDDWRGFYYDYDKLTPGPVFRTSDEVIEWIGSCEAEFDPAQIDAFREQFMSACDGHATDRIMQEVFGKDFPCG